MGTVYTKDISVPKPGDLGTTPWELAGLLPITLIFGKNGSGKSRLLRAWRDISPDTNHYVAPERSGELEYNANLLHAQLEGQSRRSEAGRNTITNYRQHIIARIQGYFTTRGSVRGTTVTGDPAELERLLTTLLPDFLIELRGAKNPPYELKRSSGVGTVGNIDQLSSGEAQLLTVGLDVLTISAMWDLEGRDTRILLIDEPDAHIHPDLQVRFADFLVSVANRFKLQIVIASHSTTLLAAVAQFSGEKGGVIYLDRTRSSFKAEPFSKYKKEIASCLGGHALMGPLFGVPLLLVEGDDDYRIWSQVPRHHNVSFAVIPCSGDEIDHYQKNLEQLFASLRDDKTKPAGFALLDGDKVLPDPANPDRPQVNIKFLRLSCHEAENLYLSDEVLTRLGTNWAQASAAIVAAAPNYGAKQARLAAAATWDRAQVDLKDLMDQLTAILDTKNVHWTIRVAREIGERRPQGQLATFLGDSVINALWGEPPAAAPQPAAPEQAAAGQPG